MNTNKNEVNNINESVYHWWGRFLKSQSMEQFNEYHDYAATKNKKLSFKEALIGMCEGKEFGSMCDYHDSEVRREIFSYMCDLFDLDYEIIYDLWIWGFEGVCKMSVIWEKFAKYRGKNPNRLSKKVEKTLHIRFKEDATVEYIKGRFAKCVEGYENLKKFYDLNK